MKSLSLIIGIVFLVLIVYGIGIACHDDMKNQKFVVKINKPLSFVFFSTRQDLIRDIRGIIYQISALISAFVLIPELILGQFLGFETVRNLSILQLIMLFGVQFVLSTKHEE